jgi:hypothetical protein
MNFFPYQSFEIGSYVELDPESIVSKELRSEFEWADPDHYYLFETTWKGEVLDIFYNEDLHLAFPTQFSGYSYLVGEVYPKPNGFITWMEQELLNPVKIPRDNDIDNWRWHLEQAIKYNEHRYEVQPGLYNIGDTITDGKIIPASQQPIADFSAPIPPWMLYKLNPDLFNTLE